jgi:hypothetical protein
MNIKFRTGMCILLSLIFFNLNQPLAQAAQQDNKIKIISTMSLVNTIDRATAEKELSTMLKSEEATAIIAANGFNLEQIDLKLASLSDSEIKDLQNNMNQAKAGGILVTVVLVLLIIYLAQKI